MYLKHSFTILFCPIPILLHNVYYEAASKKAEETPPSEAIFSPV